MASSGSVSRRRWPTIFRREASDAANGCRQRSAMIGVLAERGGDLLGDALRKQGRHGVADLRLNGRAAANELDLVRKREQPPKLGDPEPLILPVERVDVRTRLGLDG